MGRILKFENGEAVLFNSEDDESLYYSSKTQQDRHKNS